MFAGAAIGIISFNEDVNMTGVLVRISEITNIPIAGLLPVALAYSFGIAAGFVLVTGLFRKKKISPLQINNYKQNDEERRALAGMANKKE